jgi:hypothetical protein
MAVNTTNGAGPHNLQMFFLSADGTVLHCLPGYWNPDDLVQEMTLADQLNTVWQNPKLTRAAKNALFTQMQLGHIKEHSQEMTARSQLQRFDQSFELSHAATSDFVVNSGGVQSAMVGWAGACAGQLKTTDVVLHERMAVRQFLPFQNFDVAVFSNYGTQHYDKHEFLTEQRIARMQECTGRELDVLGNRWGDTRQSEMSMRRREQISDQMKRQKEQLNREFDPTQEGRAAAIRPPRTPVVQVYNWNSSGQQISAATASASANESAANLMTNYANTYQRTVSQQKNRPFAGQSRVSFVGPAAQASGLGTAQPLLDARTRSMRYVRNYSYGAANAHPAYVSSPYGNIVNSNAVYQTTTNAQASPLPNQTVYPQKVSAVVRGTIVNRPTNLTPEALRARQGELGIAASSKTN